MSERNDRDERNSERRAAEGVRIIGPEEAQAALDAGQAAGRRAEDELRFGDVPPAPAGPRPPHRFPLPDSVDPAAAVPRPPLAVVQPTSVQPTSVQPASVQPASVHPASAAPPVPAGAHAIGAPDAPPEVGAGVEGPDAHDDEHTAPLPLAPDMNEPSNPSDPPVHGSTGGPPTAATPPGQQSVPPAPSGPPGGATPTWAETSAWGSPGAAGAGDRGARWTPEGYGRQPSGPQPAPYQGPWSERPWSERPPLPTVPPAPEPTASPSVWTPPPYVPAQAPSPSVPAQTPSAVGPPPHHVASDPARPDAGFDQARPNRAGPDQAGPDQALPDRAPNEGMTVTGGSGTELPHWTDPPTGEVPRIRPESGQGDDLAAWEALGARGTRWRDDSKGWDEVDDLVDEEAPVGVLDQTRAEHSDLYSFDEDFERLEEERSGSHRALDDDYEDFDDEEEPVVVGAGASAAPPLRSGAVRSRRPGPGGRPPGGAGASNDLGSRAAVGVLLVVLLLVAYAVGPLALLVLSTAVAVAAAVEVYGMLQRSGFRPATLLGLVATAGIMFAAYWRGIGALGLLVALVFVVTMLWYLLGIVEARPLANVAVTLVAFVWVGVLGSYAALLLRAHHGRGLFVGAILPAVAADIVAYFVGRRVGSRLLAPSVSPGKTLEGVLGGGVAAIVVGLIVGHWISPWGGVKHGLLLGLAVAILAPVGDLFESMIKRDLSVKDSGTALPGHGGVLDRFDSVLLVLPAAFYLASLFNVVR